MVTLPEATRLENFSIDRVLGQGGFGITYLAKDGQLDRHVAIKEYFPQFWANRDQTDGVSVTANTASQHDYKWGLESFLKEAKTLARFKHASIVHVNRILEANGTAYMVLEYEDGDDFSNWLDKLKRPPAQEELDSLTSQLLDALSVIHANKLLHRDISPDNIYIRKDGTPVLLDFGSAREALEKRTKTVTGFFKRGYSPMEQRSQTSKHQGAWTDIYALGATLYRAISGEDPQDAQDRLIDDELVPAVERGHGSYRGDFLNAIDKALAVHYRDRPQSVEDWEKLFGYSATEEKTRLKSKAKKTGPDRDGPEDPSPDPVQAPLSPKEREFAEQREKALDRMREQLAKEQKTGKDDVSDAKKEPAAHDEFEERRNRALARMREQLEKERAPGADPSEAAASDEEDIGRPIPDFGKYGAILLVATPALLLVWTVGFPYLALAALALLLLGIGLMLESDGSVASAEPEPEPAEPEHVAREREAREKMRAVLKREAQAEKSVRT